jgi:transposase
MPLRRKRAKLRAHIQHTHRQYNLPEMGQKLAYKGTRDGVADRFLEPAVQKRVEVDLALIDHDARLLRHVELPMVQTAKQHKAQALYRRQSVPGIGQLWSLVLRYAMHAIPRCPRVQACVSYCRLGKCAKAAAGQRSGTSGKKLGNASLTWAFSAAAVLCLRHKAQGQKLLARLAKTHGQGKAWTLLAHQLARASSYMWARDPGFELDRFLNGYGSSVGAPAASLDT